MVTASLGKVSILRILGSSPLQLLSLKYGMKYLTKSKKQAPLQFSKIKLKKWFPNGCPCKLFKTDVGQVVFL